MRPLPDIVRGSPAARPRSIADALGPLLGYAAGAVSERRIEEAALTLLASVWAQRGPAREQLVADRLHFDQVANAAYRCPERRGGER